MIEINIPSNSSITIALLSCIPIAFSVTDEVYQPKKKVSTATAICTCHGR